MKAKVLEAIKKSATQKLIVEHYLKADDKHFTHYQLQNPPEQLRTVSLPSILGQSSSAESGLINEFLERQEEVSKAFADEVTFRLMAFVLCLSPPPPSMRCEPQYSPELLALRNRYMKSPSGSCRLSCAFILLLHQWDAARSTLQSCLP